MWRHFEVIWNTFPLLPNFAAVNATVMQLRIKLESCWDMNKYFIQGSPTDRDAENSCGWGVWRFTWPYRNGISPVSLIWKIKHDFFCNTATFRTLTAQILVLQPRGQLGCLNSNLMSRLDGHFNFVIRRLADWNCNVQDLYGTAMCLTCTTSK